MGSGVCRTTTALGFWDVGVLSVVVALVLRYRPVCVPVELRSGLLGSVQ